MNVRPFSSDRITAWHVAGAAILAFAGILATWQAWADMYTVALRDEEYSHIFLVPIVSAWLIWVRRMRLRHMRPSFTLIGPLFIAVGWLSSHYGFNHGVTACWHAGAVLIVLGCLLSVLGKNVLLRFWPAVAVLVFLVPVPQQYRLNIALPLQSWTANVSQTCLHALGVDTEVHVNQININGRPVEIADACSGLRMIFPLILIVYAFVFGLPLRQNVRALLLLLSPLVAVACNVVRTVPTIWLAGMAQERAAAAGIINPKGTQYDRLFDVFHNYSGWIMLPLAFVIMLLVIRVMRWTLLPVTRYTLAGQ